ncbi:hypothetical protein PoB_004688300 [Plakobranchus ocellatus]|uniref:Uncharacterized protein n=1 Tax=Plakobranchus ocellatus TaxID=259542 RepID=A0AAV4BLD2_9GAST|nr:hypothetical protein PoB_004688300 [Plakobranchus ocellatus]
MLTRNGYEYSTDLTCNGDYPVHKKGVLRFSGAPQARLLCSNPRPKGPCRSQSGFAYRCATDALIILYMVVLLCDPIISGFDFAPLE